VAHAKDERWKTREKQHLMEKEIRTLIFVRNHDEKKYA